MPISRPQEDLDSFGSRGGWGVNGALNRTTSLRRTASAGKRGDRLPSKIGFAAGKFLQCEAPREFG